MAYVNDRWLDRDERQARIDILAESVTKLADAIRAGKATDYHIDMFRRNKAELAKLKRVHRAEVDMRYFFYEYFSEKRNPGNPDNLVPTTAVDMDQAPEFHVKLSRILDSVSNRNRTARIAWAASRGHAKSAYLSNAFPVHEIVYRKRKMILIISETNAGSKKFIKWVSSQLKYNLKLREDFGELLSTSRSQNEKDAEEAFLTSTKIKMEATSLGTQIRGFRNGSQRPDLIILDDLESRDSNNTPELRQKAKDWLNQDLMPAYDPTQTAVIFMGTLVHHDSLLNYVLTERRDFIKNKFPAIIEWPERMDLWKEFERIYREYEPTEEELAEMEEMDEETGTPNANAAMRFYEANRDAMDAGAQVLWQDRFPLPLLFLERVNYGSKAFNTEFMNIPLDEESQIFKPDHFYYYDDIAFSHKQYYFGMGLDFAMGKERGDYSALITLAKHKVTNKVYVVDAYLARVHPDKFLEVVVDKVRQYQPDVIGAEAQMAQEFFVDKLKEALQYVGYPAHNRVKKIQQRARKELRIEAMLPDIEAGNIVFKRGQHELLIEQFERYGSRWHDDGPDGMATGLMVLKRPRTALKSKPKWM